MKKKHINEQTVFNVIGGATVGLFALACLIPFILIVSGSFSNESEVIKHGYSLLPQGFSLDAYKTVFEAPEKILYGYRNTIFYTTVGTIGGIFFNSITGYVLSRKYFRWRNVFSFLIYFTTLFSGGLVPTYLWMMDMGMKNTIWVMILPGMLSMFNIMIMRNFIATIPDAIAESAQMDGANEFTIFIKLILPLMKPAIATIGLFLALQYWNSWYNCMLYVSDYKLHSLQYYLYMMLNSVEEIKKLMELGATVTADMVPPAETVKLAMTCVATGPILLLYPFVQRYFVKGIMIGAVKG